MASAERAAGAYSAGFHGGQTLRYGHVTAVVMIAMEVVGYDVEAEEPGGGPGESYQALLGKPGTDALQAGDGIWLLFDREGEDPTILVAGGAGTGGETVYRTVITGRLGFLAE